MGIVINQSIRNTIITYIGFAIGAVNTLYMYVKFLGDTYYGLVGYILSSANILMPLMAFGVHNTLVKYFNEYKTEREKSEFLTFILFLPLLLVIPFSLIAYFGYHQIAGLLAQENLIVYDYVWQIPVIGLSMGYFEIFYAWVKVHLQSVLGSFIKEVLLRILISISLFAVYFNWITPIQFVYTLMGIYLFVMLLMKWFAFRVRFPSFTFKRPSNSKAIITYSLFIILTGGIANLFLEIDKFMLNWYVQIENIAYYSVAIFIATVIAVPSRAMHQITYPITAKLMTENKLVELNELYKKTSITLQIIGGLIFVGILTNINELYVLLPKEYSGGIFVVFTIGLSKYFDLTLGNNNAIIFNSQYYRIVLFLGILLILVTVGLNMIFIPLYGLKGTAFATLLSITLYSLSKLVFVVFKMKLFPFSINTIKSFGVLITTFLVFYFWDFGFHPILNIALKSILITFFYTGLSYYFSLSEDINLILNKVFKRIGLK
ncbi:oligosaccharide flippase family protein [Flavobacterium jejuense]|uniref:Oligosaccharide flippase family protein n=1 Tax=Flavobacterium jejuense TaxID=1544455 RepID=A0ABX0IQF9_9FLAO|nr:oligosaccharide flippase family protein [Flavobacterium jejuense]NHN24356.1 oligosaccharide flippase family protein [Flavobacterium jejuense]